MFDTSENMPLLLKLSFELRCCWSFGPLPRRPCFSCDWAAHRFDWQLQSSYVSCQVPNVTETQLIGQRGWEEKRNAELSRKQNILCMATLPLLLLLLPPSTTPSPPTASHLHPFPSSFHFCHSLIFLLHEIRFDSKSPQACQMTDNPSQFYH